MFVDHSLGHSKLNSNCVLGSTDTEFSLRTWERTHRGKKALLLSLLLRPILQELTFAPDVWTPLLRSLHSSLGLGMVEYFLLSSQSPEETLRTRQQLRSHWNEVDIRTVRRILLPIHFHLQINGKTKNHFMGIVS